MSVRDSDFENVDPGEERRLLLPGLYPARYVSYDSREYVFRGKTVEKLIVCWEVFTSLQRETGTLLYRFYGLERAKGNRFKFGPLSGFRKDWVAANRGRLPLDRNKLPIAKFKEGRFLVQVVTVSCDVTGRRIPGLEWSRINAVLRPIEDNEPFERLPVEPLEQAG